MSITLTDGTTTIALHADLFWSDELTWQPVEQSAQRTITGALIVQSALKVAGRPITLQSIDDGSAWMSRDTVDGLRNWAAVLGKVLTLTLRAQTYTVIFRHQDSPSFEGTQVKFQRDVDSSDWYTVVLRLMEI